MKYTVAAAILAGVAAAAPEDWNKWAKTTTTTTEWEKWTTTTTSDWQKWTTTVKKPEDDKDWNKWTTTVKKPENDKDWNKWTSTVVVEEKCKPSYTTTSYYACGTDKAKYEDKDYKPEPKKDDKKDDKKHDDKKDDKKHDDKKDDKEHKPEPKKDDKEHKPEPKKEYPRGEEKKEEKDDKKDDKKDESHGEWDNWGKPKTTTTTEWKPWTTTTTEWKAWTTTTADPKWDDCKYVTKVLTVYPKECKTPEPSTWAVWTTPEPVKPTTYVPAPEPVKPTTSAEWKPWNGTATAPIGKYTGAANKEVIGMGAIAAAGLALLL